MADVYALFSKIKRVENAPEDIIKIWNDYDSYRDFSEEALEEFFRYVSLGEDFPLIRNNNKINGFREGQKNFNLTRTEYWIPDIINRELFKEDLYNSEIPNWFLDKVLKN